MTQNTTIDLIFDDWRYLSIYLYRNIGIFFHLFPDAIFRSPDSFGKIPNGFYK